MRSIGIGTEIAETKKSELSTREKSLSKREQSLSERETALDRMEVELHRPFPGKLEVQKYRNFENFEFSRI